MSEPTIAVVDYRLSNLFSVRMACTRLGYTITDAQTAGDIERADAVILPGVGAFGEAMANLQRLDMIAPILDHIQAQKPLFGVCLGLQLLFEESEEFGSPRGLGVLPGRVRRLHAPGVPIPQIGWNTISAPSSSDSAWSGTPLAGTRDQEWMYFVHSFFVDNAVPEHAVARTTYGDFKYTSAVNSGSVFATQFHPEKSAAAGLGIYKAWLSSLASDTDNMKSGNHAE
jgi:glutamine amidotransferase